MSLFRKLGVISVKMPPYLNTGTLLDLSVGKYEKGVVGRWLLNGGIAPMTGVVGRAQTFKSTTVDSLIAQILLRYPSVSVLKHDTENNAHSLERFDAMAGQEVTSRIELTSSSITDLPDFVKLIQQVCEYKEANRKEMIVETDFVDPNTGGPLKMWIPTIIDIDSFSMLRSSAEHDLMLKVSVEDSKHNMSDMSDGKIKAKLMRLFSADAYRYGLYFIFTAHVDDAYNLDPYNPTPKQLQWMKQADRIKGVGSQFEFLTNMLLQVTAPKVLATKEKECEYPHGASPAGEISELNTVVLRCKTSASGTVIPFVMSQTLGVLSGLTNYHYLKNNDDFGFTVKGHIRRCVLCPEITLTRKTIREEILKSYELSRALEVLAQMKFMALNWSNNPITANIPAQAESMVEAFDKGNSIKVSDIVNSRGYWSYGDHEREYLSTMDIIELLSKK